MNSENIEPKKDRLIWLGQVTVLAALICSLWMIYRFYTDNGLGAVVISSDGD